MLVLLTFVGQAFASVVMSSNMPMKSTATLSTENNNACHGMNMQMGAMNDNDCDNCCAQTCHCPVGSCLPVGLVMAMPILKLETNLFSSTAMSTFDPIPQYRSSLYRPPIFA